MQTLRPHLRNLAYAFLIAAGSGALVVLSLCETALDALGESDPPEVI